ncbi:MAG: VWA domain-containing protein [Flammeovirgaceae bacterium]|nr:VWA domain-containing protein [Flammeovirgaceae bacterium]MDW8286597.1 VWA domain-containing protein [Flammeovirgaceae bacterium]
MDDFTTQWLSLSWLSPETLQKFQWENAFFLYFLPIIPFLYFLRWLLSIRLQQKLDIALPEGSLKEKPITWLRFLPPVLMMLALAFLLVALARPQLTNETVEQWTEGIDIIITMDISESMQIEDFTPNRLEAAKKVATDFIKGRFQDRIGIVIFSGEAISYAPLTTDYDLLYQLIENITFNMIGKGGTAIGSGLAVAINRMAESDAKSKVIILLSDGENNAGSIDPITAANLAFAYGIKIYTIAVGKEGRVPFGTDIFGRPRYIDQSLDERQLREIAKIGKGEFFRATDNETLERIFNMIDKYEKAEIKENRYKDTKDFYPIYLTFATLFFLAWLLSKSTFLTNALED